MLTNSPRHWELQLTALALVILLLIPSAALAIKLRVLGNASAIFDDFDGPWDWENFEACMARVLPGRHFERLELEDAVFQSFCHIKTLEMPAGYGSYEAPSFWGMRDDDGRLLLVANFNNDIGEYWEWAEYGYYPIELTNEGYKFGVNYVIFALTH